MTALCGGGSSSPKPPLTNPYVIFTADKLVNLVATGGMTWLQDWVPGAGQLTFHLPDFCAQDPPPMPTIDAARVASWAIAPTGAAILRSDMNAIISNIIWPTLCQCDVAPQPPPLTPVPPPPGVTLNPPKLTTPTGSPCAAVSTVGTAAAFDASGGFTYDNQNWFAFPATTQWCSYSVNVSGSGAAAAYPFDFQFVWKTSTGGTILDTTVYTQTQQDPTFGATVLTTPFPQGATYPVIKVHSAAAASKSFQVSVEFTPYCTAPGPDLQEPCCPPDPVNQQLLFQIYSTVSQILAEMGGSHQYTRGTRHTGLTGSGTLAVSNLFGVLVELTNGVPTNPLLPGVPAYQFSVGWISCLTGDGMIDEVRLTREAQVWSPRLAPYATVFGYQLNPGFTADITELLPLPAPSTP